MSNLTETKSLASLMGKKVTFFCASYIYTGILVHVNENFVEIKDPAIVYETGDFANKEYANEQKVHMKTFLIQMRFIESFGLKK